MSLTELAPVCRARSHKRGVAEQNRHLEGELRRLVLQSPFCSHTRFTAEALVDDDVDLSRSCAEVEAEHRRRYNLR